MRKITKGAAVRTNNKWRAFFKTDEVVRGLVTGTVIDSDTAVVYTGQENVTFHKDWLELDKNVVKRRAKGVRYGRNCS